MEGKKQISKCVLSKCIVNGIMYNTGFPDAIRSPTCNINKVRSP